MKKIVFAVAVLCIAVAIVLVFALRPASGPVLRVEPAGERDIVLEYGQTYEEAGAEAVAWEGLSKDRIVPVETEGTVDAQKVGTYMVRYRARYKDSVGTAYRRVRVVDTQAPVIQLSGGQDQYIRPGEPFVEEGYSAADNYDGDITAQVQVKQTDDAVIYTVTDSSGNVSVATRRLLPADTVAPVVTLKGDKRVVLAWGDGYPEPGFTAVDNCEGDVTSRVKVSGSVSIYRPGTYTLTYSVADAFGNVGSATREVVVKEWEPAPEGEANGNGKVIYLTFDDGPGPHTDRLLDILKAHDVKATFFVVDTKYISTVKRAAEEGHAVGIHTATHVFKDIYASEEAYFADLEQIRKQVETYTGTSPVLMRFPGGSSNTISKSNKGIMTRLAALVEEKGYTYFDWNVDSKDAGGATTPEEVLSNVIEGVGNKSHSVVLMHDIKSYTVDAVEWIIRWGKSCGYTFAVLTPDGPTCHHVINN
ncbi:MAG: polysaccharide deacetylase family protein [Oscillospiraceae bacterium]|nr:polysaccharide deacetylase family protein [Oscillospiraceae bacterium]